MGTANTNTIRIRTHLESDTPHLPELKPFIGKNVEIIVREQVAAAPEKNPYDALFELAGKDVVDPEAYKELRAASMV